MALLGNFCRSNTGSGHPFGGSSQSLLPGSRFGCGEHRARYGMQDGDTAEHRWSQVPAGYYPPAAYYMPIEAGACATRYGDTQVGLGMAASGACGLSAAVSADMGVDMAADGYLVASAVVSATMGMDASLTIAGIITGLVTASLGLDMSAAALSGIGHSPAVTANMAVDASGAIWALGWCADITTADTTTLTPSAIALAVVHQLIGGGALTVEAALLAAGSAGDPWTGIVDGMTAREVLAAVHQIIRNKTVTDPATGTMTVYAADGITPLLTANLFQDAAGATPYAGAGAERRERLE